MFSLNECDFLNMFEDDPLADSYRYFLPTSHSHAAIDALPVAHASPSPTDDILHDLYSLPADIYTTPQRDYLTPRTPEPSSPPILGICPQSLSSSPSSSDSSREDSLIASPSPLPSSPRKRTTSDTVGMKRRKGVSRRARKFHCSKTDGCIKTYLNANGLKYHMQMGKCEVRVSLWA